MARRCFPVSLSGKDCGFESRPGRSFAILDAYPLLLPFQVNVSKLESNGQVGTGSERSNSTSYCQRILGNVKEARETRRIDTIGLTKTSCFEG